MSEDIVVITGAGSGLGASMAKKYSEQGFYVCLLGRNKDKLQKSAELLSGKYSCYEADVSDQRCVTDVFESIHRDIGPVGILINNAGVGVFDQAENISETDIHQMIDINLKGTIYCSQAVLPYMKELDKGIIVNIISTAGKEGKATESVYCASKFGVRGFTESLYKELQNTSIKTYAAYMGGMKTNFWDSIYTDEETKHLMNPDDVADIIIHDLKPRTRLQVNEVTIKNKI